MGKDETWDWDRLECILVEYMYSFREMRLLYLDGIYIYKVFNVV